jgi:hypothetical protein
LGHPPSVAPRLQGDAERELALRVPGLALDPARARSSIAAATSLARNASTPRRSRGSRSRVVKPNNWREIRRARGLDCRSFR